MSIQEELQTYQSELECEVSDNPEEVKERIRRFSVIISRTGYLLALTKKQHKEDMRSEIAATVIQIAKENYLSSKAQNALVDSLCSDAGFIMDFAEQVNKSAKHHQSALITLLSYAKAEMQYTNNQV